MNHKLINERIIKQSFSRKGFTDIIVKHDDEFVVVESHRLMIIPAAEFRVDAEKVSNISDMNYKAVIGNEKECVPATRTGEYKKDTGMLLVKFKTDELYGYVQEKYLKEFDAEATYKAGYSTDRNGKKWIGKILVYEDDKLVGLVLPVRVKEDEHGNN